MLLHVEYPRILNILKIFKILEVEVLWYIFIYVAISAVNHSPAFAPRTATEHSVQTIWRPKKLKKAQILRFFHFTFKTSIVDSFKRTSPIYPLYQPSCKSTLFNQNKMPTVSKKPSIIFFTVLWEIYQRDMFLRFSVFYIKKQCLRECLYLVQNNVSSQVCTFNSFLIIQ